jgi:hypothetical protein
MKEIHENYIAKFKQVGATFLENYEYSVEVIECFGENEVSKIKIYKSPTQNYVLTFATNHLDYNLGVLIMEPESKEIFLPGKFELQNGTTYAYSGENLEQEIQRLVKDFWDFDLRRLDLRGVPFHYCSQDSSRKDCSCDVSLLEKLSSAETNRGIQETIYKCPTCKGFWKYGTNGKSAIWLKIGEISDKKYMEENIRANLKREKYFPLTFFFIQEAAAAGLEVKCGSLKKIDNYYGLSCLPINLELIRKVKFHDTGGFYIKIDIFKCKQCNTYYKIIEEYDSHHGSNYACMKLNETMEFYGGEIIEFKEEEINEL